MNVLDVLFLALVAIFTLFSLTKGAHRELFPVAGLLTGFLFAGTLHLALAKYFTWIHDPRLAGLLAYLLVVAGGYAIGVVLSGLGERMARDPHGFSDRLFGGLLGILKGSIFSLVIFELIVRYVDAFQDLLRHGRSYGWMMEVLRLVRKIG
ncbi:MAG: CvpA family protein [Deltaproteobacteria bacterium]|nr:CvpA family protein [Deltaproteobacteria bacterium]